MSTASAASVEDEAEKDTNDTSGVAEDSNALNAAASPKKPWGPRMGAVNVDWLFSAQADNPLITINCGDDNDKSFVVLKLILTRNSDFFDKCLNKPWVESQTSIVHLPNIKPAAMELYITLATRQALVNTASKDEPLVRQRDFLRPNNFYDHLNFYKTCDYLQNKELAKSVQEMIFNYLSHHRVPGADKIKRYCEIFADCFDMLQTSHPAHIRIQRRFVKAFCARVSFEAYFEYCEILRERHAFVFAVTRQLALNAMWQHPSTKAKADEHKMQRMRFDDDSEMEG